MDSNPTPVQAEETEDEFIVEGPDLGGKMIMAINKMHNKGEIYAGTVSWKEIYKRRTRNKMARKTRRSQRKKK